MRKYLFLFLATAAFLLNACSKGHSQANNTNLSAKEFSAKINQTPAAEIIDVRTPEEFSKGHLPNAKNFNWNGNDFKQQIATLDKTKPVFVYCLSGGRSSSAASHLRTAGFKEVYELEGGIMKWRAASLPETNNANATAKGLSKQQFEALLTSDKLVLVDFYADWCAPCKKMEPYLKEISTDLADKVVVLRINADDNKELCQELNIDALPVLQLYKNKTMTWTNTGFISKEAVLKQLQ